MYCNRVTVSYILTRGWLYQSNANGREGAVELQRMIEV